MVLNGVNNPINQAISVTLPPGAYNLLLLGIDWGGPAQFDVNVNGTEHEYPPTDSGDGLVFHPAPISITV